MAKAIASRLLHEPTLRMKRAAGSDEAYLYVSALRELFGLDGETEPEAEGGANVTELREAIPAGVPLNFFEPRLWLTRWRAAKKYKTFHPYRDRALRPSHASRAE